MTNSSGATASTHVRTRTTEHCTFQTTRDGLSRVPILTVYAALVMFLLVFLESCRLVALTLQEGCTADQPLGGRRYRGCAKDLVLCVAVVSNLVSRNSAARLLALNKAKLLPAVEMVPAPS